MDNPNKRIEEIASNDFQRKLFDWFDKRGLLSELRAFMRHRMISALYSSESPCSASHISSETAASPTLQVILLLVAEFLVRQEYHYTMSVLVAEAPLLASFPKFSGYVSYMSKTDSTSLNKGCDLPRYSEKDVQEILEVLGLTSDSESVEHILRLYSNNNARESLLACVLTALTAIVQSCSDKSPKQNKNQKNLSKRSDEVYTSTQWIEEIRLVLLRAHLTSGQMQHVEELLCSLRTETATKVRQEENEKHSKLMHIREQELLAESLIREERFRAQTQETEQDFQRKQKHLEQVTIQLQQQHDEVLSRLNRVQRHADEIKRQEDELSLREKSLEKKEALIEEEHCTLSELRKELQEAAHSLRQEHSDAKAIIELSHLQERCLHLELELKEAKNQIRTCCVQTTDTGIQATQPCIGELSNQPEELMLPRNIELQEHHLSAGSSLCSSREKPKERKGSSQVVLLKRVLCRVQQENSELRAFAAQQRRRIDELTSRATQLASHIAGQAEVAESISTTRAQQTVPESQPYQPNLYVPQAETNDSPTHGSVFYSHSNTAHSCQVQGKNWRRKHPKYSVHRAVLSTSFSSDESPTEEILREARNRLRRLEEDSEAVDRSYRDFLARQVDGLACSSSRQFIQPNQTSKNVSKDSSYQESQCLNAVWPDSPSLLRSTPFPSSFGAARVTSTLQNVPRTTIGLTSSFLSSQQPRFASSERSLFAAHGADHPSRLRNSMSSSLNRSAVLGRPGDKLKNLFTTRSNVLRFYARERIPHTSVDESLTPTTCQRKLHVDALEDEKVISDISKVTEESQKINLEIFLHESSRPALPEKSMKEPLLDKDDPLPENEKEQRENQIDKEMLSEDKGSTQKEKIQESSNPQMNQITDAATEEPLSVHSLLVVEKNAEASQNADQNLSLSLQHLHSQDGKVLSEIQHIPEKHIAKSNLIDATLNEISTLSSSPALSTGNVENVETKEIPTTGAIHLENEKLNFLSSPSTNIEYQHTTQELPSTSKIDNDEMPQRVGDVSALGRQGNVSTPGKTGNGNQLLMTSLSSIENTDHHVSVGSVGEKTDDDDFW